MKKQLLAVALVSLLSVGLTGKANAESAGTALTGNLAGVYTITPASGTGTIDATDGTWTGIAAPSFVIASNNPSYKIRVSAVAGNGSQALANYTTTPAAGKVKIALSQATATSAAVIDALDTPADATANPKVITYDIVFAGANATFGTTLTNNQIVADATAGTTIAGTITDGNVEANTFDATNDPPGAYSATITLSASDT